LKTKKNLNPVKKIVRYYEAVLALLSEQEKGNEIAGEEVTLQSRFNL